MKVSRIVGAVVFLAGAFAPSAFAQVQVDTWDQLKDVCQNPGRVNLQRPPGEITTTCVLNRKTWRQNETIDELGFPGQDQIDFEGANDKTTALSLRKMVDLPQEVLQCPRAEQVEEIYNLSFSTSCDEIVGFEGDFGDFCYYKMQADTESLEDYKVSEAIVDGSEISLCNVEGSVVPAGGDEQGSGAL